MKVVTVTLNPCIDETLTISGGMKPGGTNRVIRTRKEISGKGLNISFLLAKWGEETLCTGFDFQTGSVKKEKEAQTEEGVPQSVAERCGILKVPYDLITMHGDLRTNHKIFDETTKTMTEFNAQGECTEKDAEARFLDRMTGQIREMDREDILVCTGSVPSGISDMIYAKLIKMAAEKGIRTVLDASGALLKNGAEAVPYVMKPNADEIAFLMGKKEVTKEEIIRYGRTLLDRGIQYLCVTLGAEGALFLSGTSVLYAPPLELEVRGIQGAGDSVAAGICLALERGLPEKEIFRYGMAAAGGSLLREGTEMCELEDFKRLLPNVRIISADTDNL